MKNEKGFTLLEMMIVLLVISVLLIVMVPNVAGHNSTINDKGCDAYLRMVEAQVQVFEMDKDKRPESVSELSSEGYLADGQETCPHGDVPIINGNGEVSIVHKEPDET